MLAVCEKHARKQHSGLQSRMEFRGFRANVNPLAIYIYIIYIYCILRYWDIDILIIWVKVLPSTYPKMSFNTANKPWFWPFSKRCCLSGCHFYNEVSMLCCSHLSIGWLQHPEWLRVHFVLKKYRGSSPICLIKSPFGGEYCGVCVCQCGLHFLFECLLLVNVIPKNRYFVFEDPWYQTLFKILFSSYNIPHCSAPISHQKLVARRHRSSDLDPLWKILRLEDSVVILSHHNMQNTPFLSISMVPMECGNSLRAKPLFWFGGV